MIVEATAGFIGDEPAIGRLIQSDRAGSAEQWVVRRKSERKRLEVHELGCDQFVMNGQAMSLVLASLSLFGLCIFGPGIASGLVAGAPQLGAGAVAGTVIGAAGSTLSRPDRAIVLIGACIAEGFNTRYLIVKWLRVLGLEPKHVRRRLAEQTGDVRGIHLWRCDDEGVYHLLDEA